MSFLESLRANDGSGNELRPIAFDPLEALAYLESGFVNSPLDAWFIDSAGSSVPPSDVHAAESRETVTEVLGLANRYLDETMESKTEEHDESDDDEASVSSVCAICFAFVMSFR